jgi:hypothetical protein
MAQACGNRQGVWSRNLQAATHAATGRRGGQKGEKANNLIIHYKKNNDELFNSNQ